MSQLEQQHSAGNLPIEIPSSLPPAGVDKPSNVSIPTSFHPAQSDPSTGVQLTQSTGESTSEAPSWTRTSFGPTRTGPLPAVWRAQVVACQPDGPPHALVSQK